MKLRSHVRELAQSQTRLQRRDLHLNLVPVSLQRAFSQGTGCRRARCPGVERRLVPGPRVAGAGADDSRGDRRQHEGNAKLGTSTGSGASCGSGAQSLSDPLKSGESVYLRDHQRNYPVPSFALYGVVLTHRRVPRSGFRPARVTQ